MKRPGLNAGRDALQRWDLNRVLRVSGRSLSRLATSARRVLADSSAAAQVLRALPPLPSDPLSRVDLVRAFVHRHSEHGVHAQHADYAFDVPEVLRRLAAHATSSGDAPPLSCGPRAFAMRAILGALGIESRVVSTFADLRAPSGGFESHTFLSVRPSPSDDWHVQDPDYDLYYVERAGAERVDLLRLVLGDLESIEPCRGGAPLGWEEFHRARLRRDYFKAALFDNRPTFRPSLLVLNTQRFPEARDPDSAFRRYADETLGQPEVLLQRGWD